MMDELKLKLSTKFMKNILAGIISKAVFKKTGHKVNVDIDEISIEMIDGMVRFHTSVDAIVSEEEFKRIIQRLI